MRTVIGDNVVSVIQGITEILEGCGKTTQRPNPNSQAGVATLKELDDVLLAFNSWHDRDVALSNFKLSKEFLEAEFEQWFDPTLPNPGSAFKQAHNKKNWERALNDQGKFYYTYGERIHPGYQHIVNLLRVNPATRQGFLAVWRDVDLAFAGKERIPCTLGYQFTPIGPGSLHLTMMMRSTDLYNCLPNDVWLGTQLLERMCRDSGMAPCGFTLITTNLHAYK